MREEMHLLDAHDGAYVAPGPEATPGEPPPLLTAG